MHRFEIVLAAFQRQKTADALLRGAEAQYNLSLAMTDGGMTLPAHVQNELTAAIVLRRQMMLYANRLLLDVAPTAEENAAFQPYFYPATGDARSPFARAFDEYHNATCAAQWALGCLVFGAPMWSDALHAAMTRIIAQQNAAYTALRAADVRGVLDPARRHDVELWGESLVNRD